MTGHVSHLAITSFLASGYVQGQLAPIVVRITLVIARAIISAPHFLGTAVRRFRDKIRRYGFPVQTVRIKSIKTKVRRTFDRQTFGFTTLDASAERDTLVVPFRSYFVRFSHMAARAFIRHLVRDIRLDYLCRKKDL